MCLAVPGMIEAIVDDGALTRTARVNFAGVVREVNTAFVPDAGLGDYVIVHAGIAISRLDAIEARRVLDDLDSLASS
ncbi:MAG: HypC/HybG/HupF family hydrogenase formation chaperone [Gammaproteobacteria bacterium]|nr:HypC/HybG/HupF family hydrogenase formation chaperone [Gammaproteobacteria bacterium]